VSEASIKELSSAGVSGRHGAMVQKLVSNATLRAAIIVICFVWTLPTVGVLISSFRNANDIRSSGWWTVFESPFELTKWTLENYAEVIASQGMGEAFLNSLIVTIPATILPITIAAFAAYAFCLDEVPRS
jgi:alpha-glucoside transport system permease protein